MPPLRLLRAALPALLIGLSVALAGCAGASGVAQPREERDHPAADNARMGGMM